MPKRAEFVKKTDVTNGPQNSEFHSIFGIEQVFLKAFLSDYCWKEQIVCNYFSIVLL